MRNGKLQCDWTCNRPWRHVISRELALLFSIDKTGVRLDTRVLKIAWNPGRKKE